MTALQYNLISHSHMIRLSETETSYRREDAKDQVKQALGVLNTEEYRQLLEYIREWNTKPKLCHIAQFILFQVFSILPPTEIVEVFVISS